MSLSAPLASFALLVLAGLALAQGQDVVIPTAAPPRFSHIAGRYRISATASPTEVRVEDAIILKVRISGQGPTEHRPQRKHLDVFPDGFADDFHLEALAEKDLALDKTWEFVYRLRPKRVDVTCIPALKLVYYDPAPRRFQSDYSEEIAIKVSARPDDAAVAELKVVQAPARFYQLRPVHEVIRDDTPSRPGLEIIALLLLAPPLVCVGGYCLWRRRHPDATLRHALRRSRAARLALAKLDGAGDDVTGMRAAVVAFLRERIDLPPLEPTPHEVAAHLKRLGFGRSVAADWATFLRACDHFQYASTLEAPKRSLHEEAIRLIHAVEADPCVSR